MIEQKSEQLCTDRIVHLLYVPFTGLGLYDGYRGDEWFKNRIDIFKRYTLNSLINQTNQNFVVWVSFRPQEESNPLTQELREYMSRLKDFRFVFTFGGLCFWDDKYPQDKLLDRLRATLPSLKEVIGDADWVYETICPSDDMWIDEAVDEIQKQKPEFQKAIIWTQGHLLNARTHQVAEYNPKTIPPFTTIVYPADVFLDPIGHYAYISVPSTYPGPFRYDNRYFGPYMSHEDVCMVFNCYKLQGRGFCVNVNHGTNISTNWETFKGREYTPEESQRVRNYLGLKEIEPIK